MTFQIIHEPDEALGLDFPIGIETPEQPLSLKPKIKDLTIGLDTDSIYKMQWENALSSRFKESKIDYGFQSSPRPWLPPRVLKKIKKMRNTKLRNTEMVNLIQDIAKISIDFYSLKAGSFVAIKFDGRIAESADKETDLLMRIQGKQFDVPVFVWKVGSSSFAGWKA